MLMMDGWMILCAIVCVPRETPTQENFARNQIFYLSTTTTKQCRMYFSHIVECDQGYPYHAKRPFEVLMMAEEQNYSKRCQRPILVVPLFGQIFRPARRTIDTAFGDQSPLDNGDVLSQFIVGFAPESAK